MSLQSLIIANVVLVIAFIVFSFLRHNDRFSDFVSFKIGGTGMVICIFLFFGLPAGLIVKLQEEQVDYPHIEYNMNWWMWFLLGVIVGWVTKVLIKWYREHKQYKQEIKRLIEKYKP